MTSIHAEGRENKLLSKSQSLAFQFPLRVKVITKEETKELHLKKLYQLSQKSLGEIPQLEEPNGEQQEWLKGGISRASGFREVYDNV